MDTVGGCQSSHSPSATPSAPDMPPSPEADRALISGALHFIGFKEDAMRFNNALLVFGQPDFVHRYWDVRARQELAPGDTAVFGTGTDRDEPSPFSYDDSANV